MHAVAVEFDFVEPVVAVRRRVDQLGELRRDPLRQGGRFGVPPARYGARHDGGMGCLSGRRMRLLEVIDLADMLRRMAELEADAFAMPARRKAPAFDHGYFVRHVDVRRIVGGDGVNTGLQHNSARPVFLRHGCPPSQNLSTISETAFKRAAFRATSHPSGVGNRQLVG
jgi:hypothetical protein